VKSNRSGQRATLCISVSDKRRAPRDLALKETTCLKFQYACLPASGKFVGQRQKSRKVSRVKGFSQGRRSLNKIQAARQGMKSGGCGGRDLSSKRRAAGAN